MKRDEKKCDPVSEGKIELIEESYINGFPLYQQMNDSAETAMNMVNDCGPVDSLLRDIMYAPVITNVILSELFIPSCNSHDICYSCQQPKHYCDQNFKKNNEIVCDRKYKGNIHFISTLSSLISKTMDDIKNNINKAYCYQWAKIYSAAVSKGGAEAYANTPVNYDENCAACGVPVIQNILVNRPFYVNKDTTTELDEILDKVNAKSGNITISLLWDSPDDVDLHVLTPSGFEIYYASKVGGGGELDVDIIPGSTYSDLYGAHVENIYFEDPYSGYYEIWIVNYSERTVNSATDYIVRVIIDGVSKVFTGTINGHSTRINIMSFSYVGTRKQEEDTPNSTIDSWVGERCRDVAGTCIDTTIDSCPTRIESNHCGGRDDVRCCLDDDDNNNNNNQSNHSDDSECLNRYGTCIRTGDCIGITVGFLDNYDYDLCPGYADHISCCIPLYGSEETSKSELVTGSIKSSISNLKDAISHYRGKSGKTVPASMSLIDNIKNTDSYKSMISELKDLIKNKITATKIENGEKISAAPNSSRLLMIIVFLI